MPNIGPLELAIVLGIVLIIFGPKRLPGLGRQLGSGMKEFKDSITGDNKSDDDDDDGDRERASIAKAEEQAAEVTRERTQDTVAGEKTSDAEAAFGGSGDRH